MLPKISYQGQNHRFYGRFAAYRIGHIPVPYVMGYDTRPLITIAEKAAFLKEAADKNYYLFLEHDAYNELCTVKHTEKGVRLHQTHKFTDIFN